MADDSIWYRLGYGLEQAVHGVSRRRLRSLAERGAEVLDPRSDPGEKDGNPGAGKPAGEGEGAGDSDGNGVNALVAAGTGVAVSRLLGLWSPRRSPGVTGLVKAGAAGAAASLLHHLVRPLLRGRLELPSADRDLPDELLSGTARGLLYASVLEPRLPGPAVARGAAYGSLEYLASPWGGLGALVGKRAPHRRLPLVSSLMDPGHDEDDTWLDHVVYAVALAALYAAVEEEVEVWMEDADGEA
jgi:hypothetical protein